MVEKLLQILQEEVIPAKGCTEPIALAFVAAKAKEYLEGEIKQINIHVSGNMIKNVKSVVVPNSGGCKGIKIAVAMGVLFGDASKELLVISDITQEQMQQVHHFLEKTPIEVIHTPTDVKLYAKIELCNKQNSSLVEIKHVHTNITHIQKNGKSIFLRPCNDADFNSTFQDRETLNIKSIYETSKSVELVKIEPLLEQVINLNSAIAKEGLSGSYGVNIGKMIRDNVEAGFYGKDLRNISASFAAAGSDARMSGCALPVMTTSGSGNQGMTASLALIAYANEQKLEKEKLLRALFFSHLSTVHIKSKVGRLSAYCGVICAASAVSGALAFLHDKEYTCVSHAISNTLGNISGIICDGAKSSCAMKIATSIYAAFDGYLLAGEGRFLHGGDGIIGADIECTLNNIYTLSQQGMHETDKVIIDIMNQETL